MKSDTGAWETHGSQAGEGIEGIIRWNLKPDSKLDSRTKFRNTVLCAIEGSRMRQKQKAWVTSQWFLLRPEIRRFILKKKKEFCYKLKASFLKWVQSAWLEKENSYISTVWQHFHRMPWGIEHGIWDCYKTARWRQLAATTTFMKLIRGWTRNKVPEESNVQSASPSAESKAEGVVKVIFNWKAFLYVFNGENKTSLML